ncbi:MMPL family transporter [Methylacidiphilum caldifontis]|uniref:RND transporter n=1 Tax=Methylacidiphilum caldifontis TaxID=2795386 RepID=A0A4Y8P7C8_9BACT|nr:MMPL family transporter [Methylacidiphilum caldifontis]QSR88868.1 MMPL family transporter [Methylacidiphilum caldifontis]TFE66220.1 RND transporter [Methylacidiphilum caldifontis]
MKKNLENFLAWVLKKTCLHCRIVILFFLVLTAFSLWILSTRFKVINDTNALIRKDSPIHKYYLEYRKEFGVAEDYVVVIHGADPDENKKAALQVGEKLRKLYPLVQNVRDKLDLSKLEPHLLLYLPVEDLKKIESEIDGYVKTLKQEPEIKLDLNTILNQANAKFQESYLRKHENWKEFIPFIDKFVAILNQLADQLEQNPTSHVRMQKTSLKLQDKEMSNFRIEDIRAILEDHEFLSFEDGKLVLVTASPGKGASEGQKRTETIKKIREIVSDIGMEYPSLSIGLTGEPVLEDDQLQESSKDSLNSALLAFSLVSILFFISYREILRPAIGLVVLAMSLCWALAFPMITIGHLNIISEAFVAMVIGMGIDFGIQFMSRYEEEISGGKTILEALKTTSRHTGAAIFTGGCTTAIAFFTMCFNDFIGLQEFGIVAGFGILFCLLSSLTLLPALYFWIDSKIGLDRIRQSTIKTTWTAPKWVNTVLFFSPRGMLVLATAASLFFIFMIPKVGFDYNLLNLQNQNLDCVQWELELLNSPSRGMISALSVADNEEEAKKKAKAFEALPSVAEVRTLTTILPEHQEEKLQIVRQIVDKLKDVPLDSSKKEVNAERLKNDIDDLLQKSEEGYKTAQKFVAIAPQAKEAVDIFSKLIPALSRIQKQMKKLPKAELNKRLSRAQFEIFGTMESGLLWLRSQDTSRGVILEDLPKEVLERFLSPHGKILIEIVPKENVWERKADVQFVHDIRKVDPKVTGTPVQNYEYIELLRKSYTEAAQWAFVAIVILIVLRFQNLLHSLLALFPLVLAAIWTLGWMGYFGIPFNPANIITLPLAIGAGVAYGIYTVDRFSEDGNAQLFSTSTGKAILISGLTAVIGFASLLISSYQGLYSLGLVMTIAISFCLTTSLIILPQIFYLLNTKKNKTKGLTIPLPAEETLANK